MNQRPSGRVRNDTYHYSRLNSQTRKDQGNKYNQLIAANVGVAGHDVNVVGVDRIVVQTDEDTADSPIVVTGTSVAGSFLPGSMKDFRIYVSDTYCVDISIAAVAAAVGF
nr:hypothetical protein BgiMline_018104 [Biomphalaria glabrata]